MKSREVGKFVVRRGRRGRFGLGLCGFGEVWMGFVIFWVKMGGFGRMRFGLLGGLGLGFGIYRIILWG